MVPHDSYANNESNVVSFDFISGQDLEHLHTEVQENCTPGFDETPAERLQRLQDIFGSFNTNRGIGLILAAITTSNQNIKPLRSVLRIVRRRYRCFALLEYPYFDLEEWSSYAAFYARTFQPYPRICSRLHFFEGNENSGALLISLLENAPEQAAYQEFLCEEKLRYLGFSVLRAGSSYVVGRTAIQFDEKKPADSSAEGIHHLEKYGIPFCTTAIENPVHVSSLSLSVKAPPFMQQNPVTGVCGTASIWVSSQILARNFGLHRFSYATITQQATPHQDSVVRQRGEWMFGRGLQYGDIKEALAYTGATPYLFGPGKANHGSRQARLRWLTYVFVESGLPVIGCFTTPQGNHAVTLVGHLLPDAEDGHDRAESNAQLVFGSSFLKGRHHLLGLSVRLYYAHNDAYGPYDRIEILPDRDVVEAEKQAQRDVNTTTDKKRKSSDTTAKNRWEAKRKRAVTMRDFIFRTKKEGCLIQMGRDERFYGNLNAIIVPIPPYVQNLPEPILNHAINSIEKRSKGMPKLLWRCFLAYTPDFKRSAVCRYPKSISKQYAALHLPLYVWVIEYSVFNSTKDYPCGEKRRISGEFLYDSTTPFYEPRCLVERHGRVLIDNREQRSVMTKDLTLVPYPCFAHRKLNDMA